MMVKMTVEMVPMKVHSMHAADLHSGVLMISGSALELQKDVLI